jgi:PAS domain S-box-containing protein
VSAARLRHGIPWNPTPEILNTITEQTMDDILIVDDEIANLQLLTQVLSDAGYQVRPANDPQLAIDSALAQPPSLILLDARMPKMDGFDVCRRLKQDERTRDIPIIFVSALHGVQDRVRGFEAGGVDFISKPFEAPEILARVRTHLQLRNIQLNLEEIVSQRTAELSESESRFRATFEQAAVGIAHVSTEGKFLWVNRKYCDIVGYSDGEMLELTFQDITHSDDLDTDLEYVRRVLEREIDNYSIEKRYLCKDGSVVWVNLTISLLFDKAGSPRYFVAVVKDISDRKQAEERSRQSEAKYRNLVDNSIVGVFTTTLDGRFAFANEAMVQLYDFDNAEQMLAEGSLSLWAEPQQREQMLAELKNHGSVSSFEAEIITHTNRHIHAIFSATLRGDSISGMVMDITEFKQTERALRISESNLVKAQEVAHVGSWDLDLRANNLVWTNENYKIFGVPRGTRMTYEAFLEVVHPEDREYVHNQWAAAIEGEPYDIEHRLLIGNEVKWVREKAELAFDDEGRATRGVGITQDITVQKAVTEEIAANQARLKALATQLTIAEERERSRIAADLHDQVGQTLALARIRLAIARRSASDPKLAAMIEEASQSMLQAAKDTQHLIFDLSSPLLNEIGLGAAISDWAEKEIVQRQGIDLEFVDHAQQVPLTNDVRAILFRNVRELLTNVVKHAQASKVSVCVERDGDRLRVIVQDDGVGFLADETSTEVTDTGGFGHFSVQERMADFGGSFEIVSEPGEGCKATLTVPVGDA